MLTPPLRVAVLCSGRAPGLAHLLTNAAGYRRTWDIVCCLTSEAAFAEEGLAAAHGVAIVRHPIRQFYTGRDPQARLSDQQLRAEYDRRTVALLAPYAPNVILLAGYLRLLTAPMLAAFAGRLLNVHHADLLLRDAGGGPRYPGLRAVRDAILAGEHETRSTLHLVTNNLDDGPVLLRSPAFPVPELVRSALARGERDLLRNAIRAHQEWMLREAFGPLMAEALDYLATNDTRRTNASERAA
jgi:folate-dependent phosphoribosylglycinamide formyltransferase PurN